jgi:mannose-6-phosphate isomerase-like protein (cupin superfamily)
MTVAAMRDLWSAPGDGEHIWFLGALVTIKVPGEATDGRCTLIEFLVPMGASPPVHSHPADETFTMIDGVLSFVAGDERVLCETGASWIVPRDVHHTFRVESETAAQSGADHDTHADVAFIGAMPDSMPPPSTATVVRPGPSFEAVGATRGAAGGRTVASQPRTVETRSKESALSYQRVPPGYRFSVRPPHMKQEEVYVVVRGGGRMKLDDEIVELKEWDAVRVPPGTWRGYEAGPDIHCEHPAQR